MLYFLTSETHDVRPARGVLPPTPGLSIFDSLHLQGQFQTHSCPTANPYHLILSTTKTRIQKWQSDRVPSRESSG